MIKSFLVYQALVGLIAFLLSAILCKGAPFAAGNVAVYRIGTGIGNLINTGNPVFLDEYTSTGTLVQSIPLPTIVNGIQKRLIASGTAGSEGQMTLSADGRYLVLPGYDATPPHTPSLTGTSSTAVNRVIGRVDALGNIDTSTAITDAYSANNFRGVCSDDGTRFWMAGNGNTTTGGVRYASGLGVTTATQLSTTNTNLRQPAIFDGQLYVSSGNGSAVRLGPVGSGLPTTNAQTIMSLPGYPVNVSPNGFVLLDLDTLVAGVDTLYVADDAAGLLKYSFDGTVWTARGSVGAGGDLYRGLTARVFHIPNPGVTLFAVRKGGDSAAGGGEIVTLTDTSSSTGTLSGTPTLLATAAVNTAFRGIAFVPQRPDLTVAIAGPTGFHSENPPFPPAPQTFTREAFFLHVRLSNQGGGAAYNIGARFTLPEGLTYIMDNAGAAGFQSNFANGVLAFSGGTLAAQTDITIQITVRTETAGVRLLPAEAAMIDPLGLIEESDETNNRSAQEPTLDIHDAADLKVALSGPANALTGTTGFEYTLTAANEGLSTASSVSVTFTLPLGLSFISGSGPGFAVTESGGVVNFSGGSLASDQSETLRVRASAAVDGSYTVPIGTAVISNDAMLVDSDPGNNASPEAVTTALLTSDLTISQTANEPFQAGDSASYTFTVSNIGTTFTLGQITFHDELPAGLTATALSGAGWTVIQGTGSTVTATRTDSLPAGQSYPSLILTVAIATNAPATVTHTATISGGGDSTPVNSTSMTETSILGAGPGVIAFESTAFEIAEENGPLVLTLRRTNGRTGAISITVNTTNITALAGNDFVGLTDEIVHFADNVTTATVTVPVTKDSLVENNESFNISLSAPTGGADLGEIDSATVLILDPDRVKPQVLINSPKAAERVNEGTISASLEVIENKQLRSVEVKLNAGNFVEVPLPSATMGKVLFTLPLSPLPGVNTLAVRATDMRGNVSAELIRIFTYVVKRPLTLLYPIDEGTVTLKPAELLTALELGKSYSLMAKPATNKMWNGWVSPQLTLTEAQRLSTKLSFTMTEGLTITANFAEDPFKPAVVGDFSGLVQVNPDTPPMHDNEGAFQVKITPKGSFSGSLRISGQTFPLVGVLDTSGTARFGVAQETSLLISRAPLPGYVLAFSTDLNAAGPWKITGTVRRQTQSGSEPMSVIEANRHAFDGKTPATTTTETFYTWAMPAQPQPQGLSGNHYPQGDGVGFIKIGKTGVATMTGVLADGTAFTTGASLSAGLSLPLFLDLEKGSGSLNGWLTVDHTRPDTDIRGAALHWFKPVIFRASHYPFGWPEGLALTLQGARFSTPMGESVLPDLTETTGANAVLSFTQGALTGPIQKELSVSPANLVVKIPVSDASYAMKLDAKTGQFNGSFTHSDSTTTQFTGIILQKGANRRGFGHFLSTEPKISTGAGQSGAVSFKTKFNPRLTLVISELMADNESTRADEDGTFSDWIEIYNPGTEDVDLTDWCLTDNAAALSKWRFPSATLGSRQFMLVWASSKNRRNPGQPLHTNFSLSNGGEYLALVRPDGVTVEHEFAPMFPPQGNNESYGINFTGRALLSQGAPVRYRVPVNGSLGSSWTARDFADSSWSQGKTGLGFGVGVPGFTVRQVAARPAFGGVSSVAACEALLALPKGHANILSESTVIAPVINYLGDGSENDGHYPANAELPNGLAEPYAFKATGIITIPQTGSYVFGLNSDDGGRIKIDNIAVMTDDSNHGPQDNLSAPVTLTAGPHAVEVIMWEGGGGDCVEFWAKAGADTSWNEGFKLVGSPDGLQVVTTPLAASNSTTGVVATNLQPLMQTKNASCYLRLPFTVSGLSSLTGLTLQMRYNDGFVAYLNGTEVARRNAPAIPAFDTAATATRSPAQTLTVETIDLSSHITLLVGGTNVLAVHGMNDTRDDGTFLLLPELSATGGLAGNAVFFRPTNDVITATPGTMNGVPQYAGVVAPLIFSQKHGFYKSALSLSITSVTPSTSIRYTLDGSTPTASHGTLYNGPLSVSKTSIVRAIGFKPGFEPTPILTQSYFFLDDVIRQSANGTRPATGWPAGSVNGQVADYGMDPDVVNSTNPEIGGVDRVKSALTAIPTISIVTDLPNLFSEDNGIWVNPYNRGEAWERPASVEMIGDSGPGGGFEINCGLRLRGGFSRAGTNPKHSLRLFFRSKYGPSKLTYPLFGSEGAPTFDKIDLRTAQNYSWSFSGDESNNTFIREETTRELQGAMGQPHSRGRYYHLYLNGQYWGLYDTDERPEANFAESYIGGDADDYDTVKGEQDQGYITGVTDGNLDAWEALRMKARAHAAAPTNANYFAMSGKAADGVTPTSDPVLLQPDSLIDYMLLTFWSGNLDGATSVFLSDARANNWFAVRNRLGTFGGFRFIAHDFEHTFLNPAEDRTGPFPNADHNNAEIYNPMFLHHDLLPNAEYRMQWADHVQRHLFGQGVLTAPQVQARMRARKTVLNEAIIAESARWGDAQRGSASPLNRQHWQNAVDYVIEDYIPVRGSYVLAQLREDGLYPSFDAPSLSQNGGPIASGAEVVITSYGGTMHYTLDGSDPRLVGGAVNPAAQIYTSSTETTLIVPLTQTWKYLADGSNQGTGWRAGTFDDSAWPSGPAELGYGDGDETSVVPYVDVNPEAGGEQKNATTYFRTRFNMTNLSGLTAAMLRVKYDDAVVLYLNGTEVARSANISSNPAHNQYASGGTPDENAFFEFAVDPALLIAGENVIAAEVHQVDSGSSDISFNASLSLTRTATPAPLYLTGTGSRTLNVRALNSGEWSALVEGEFDVREAPDMRVFLSRNGSFTAGSLGSYTVTVHNSGSAASSGPVTATVTLPAGLTTTSLTGNGWTVLLGTGSTVQARRSDTLNPESDYAPITVNVSIAPTAPALASTTAAVSGGGEITLTNNADTDATPVGSTGPSQILFSNASYAASQTSASLTVTILRTGDRTGSASVRLRTSDGTAKAASDYESRNEIITFVEGETSRTIDIGLINDGRAETHEAFNLILSEADGAVSLGLLNTASARILEEDNTTPTVVLTTPSAGARVVLPTLILTGTATDDKGLGKVQASINNGDFIDAITTLDTKETSGKFTLNVHALTGANTVRVRAVDALGLVSNEVIREITFVPQRLLDLTLFPAMAGTVSLVPAGNLNLLEVGKTYTLTAKPNKGFIFERWTGPGIDRESPVLTFTMSEGLSLSAHFAAPSFSTGNAGPYLGFIRPAENVTASHDNHGLMTLNVTTASTFTGTVRLGSTSYPITGTLNAEGKARFGSLRDTTLTIPRANQSPLVLAFGINPAARTMQGVLGQQERSSIAAMSVFNGSRKRPVLDTTSPLLVQGGKYSVTMIHTPPVHGPLYPPPTQMRLAGNLTKTAVFTLTGTLADGTKFTASADLQESGSMALHVLPAGTTSSLAANLLWNEANPAITSTEGLWFRRVSNLPPYLYGWPAGLPFILTGTQGRGN